MIFEVFNQNLSLLNNIFAFSNGLATGFVMSMMLGTVFFSLIQNSIINGFKTGVMIALGVVVSDAIFVAITVFGTQMVPQIKNHQKYIESFGGVLLIFMGISMFLNKKTKIVYPKTRFGNFVVYFSNGFLLNFMNPVNLFTWAAISTYINTSLNYNINQNFIFFTTCLATIFATEVLISYGAVRVKHFFNENRMLWINRITGTVFAGFGVYLIFKSQINGLFL